MVDARFVLSAFLMVFVSQTLVELWLEGVNRRHIRRNLGQVPSEFRDCIDDRKMEKIARYTLAKSRLGIFGEIASQSLLLAVLFTGVLSGLDLLLAQWKVHHIVAGNLFFLLPGVVLYITGLPFSYYHTFVLEEEFGFNRSTLQLWLLDHLKSSLLSLLIISSLLSLLLWIIQVSPSCWWVWGFLTVSVVQIALVELYPVIIAPLFNRFEPIRDDELSDRIRMLMKENGITVRRILQMNAGLRSRHTNAYFTGLGKTKQIVLFDTMLESHPHEEILSILAHEVGHLRGKHIVKQLLVFEVLMFSGFYLAHLLIDWPPLYTAFDFAAPKPYIGLFLLGIFGQKLGFFLQPFVMALSRHFEHQADLFAVRFVKATAPLIAAFRRLAADNLSNLTPHPLYVMFHYSHPPLIERMRLLEKAAPGIVHRSSSLSSCWEKQS